MDKFLTFCFKIAPKNELSRLGGWHASKVLRGPAGKAAIKWFVKHYNVNTDEIEKPADEYNSLADFFIRKLKPGAREIDPRPDAIVSPVDGLVSNFGDINGDTLIQAKGKDYTLNALLADTEYAETFINGKYVTLYLSPRDYHRMHTPLDGSVYAMRYIPGKLFSVNAFGVRNIDNLFAVNERLVNYFDTAAGKVAYIMVGAMNVGRIRVVYDEFATNTKKTSAFYKPYDKPHEFQKGDEIGRFELGSTVILLFEKDRVQFTDELYENMEIKLGKAIAGIKSRNQT